MINIPIKLDHVLQYRGFDGTIEYDPESKTFHGESVAPLFVITYQSEDAKGIVSAFMESIDYYIEFTASKNAPSPGSEHE